MMKKLLALFFALSMLISCAFADEDLDSVVINPFLSNAIGRTATEWYKDDSSRAFLAACMLLEFPSEERPDMWETILDCFSKGSVYIARTDDQLELYIFSPAKVLLIIYEPSNERQLAAYLGDGVSQPVELMKYMKENNNIDSYYPVDKAAILDMMDLIIETLSE